MEKLEALKVGGIEREEKRKIMRFVNCKAYFDSNFFFIMPLPFHLKNDF
jgi:hypothetical protein